MTIDTYPPSPPKLKIESYELVLSDGSEYSVVGSGVYEPHENNVWLDERDCPEELLDFPKSPCTGAEVTLHLEDGHTVTASVVNAAGNWMLLDDGLQ